MEHMVSIILVIFAFVATVYIFYADISLAFSNIGVNDATTKAILLSVLFFVGMLVWTFFL